MTSKQTGIVLALLSCGFFAGAQAIAKLTMQGLPLQQVLGMGNLIAALLTFGAILLRHNFALLRPNRPAMLSLRIATGLGETWCTFSALKLLALPLFTTITSVWPLFTLPLAALFLKEKLTRRLVFLTLTGFLGVLIAAAPSLTIGSFSGIAYALLAAFGAALGVIVIRKIGTSEKLETLVLYTLGAIGILNLALLPVWIPPTAQQWSGLIAIGLGFFIGNMLITRAIQLAPASLVASLRYTTFLWASGFSWLLFSVLPDLWTVAGILFVAASGIMLVFPATTHKKS